MIVSKFGGTSVQNSDAIKQVFSIVASRKEKTFIVVSALSKVTDTLLNLISKIKEKKIDEAEGIVEKIFERHLDVAFELGVSKEIEEYFEKKKQDLIVFAKALGVLGEVTRKEK